MNSTSVETIPGSFRNASRSKASPVTLSNDEQFDASVLISGCPWVDPFDPDDVSGCLEADPIDPDISDSLVGDPVDPDMSGTFVIDPIDPGLSG